MKPMKSRLLASTVVPVVVIAAGLLAATDVVDASASSPRLSAANPPAAKNPSAAKRNSGDTHMAQRNPCNPCGAKNPCNPCAAKNPCNPCAAKNPCNPCAAGGGKSASKCVVPRLQKVAANPCAAKNPCNPCGARRNPCNPCAAKRNPCAARNPCNPCAAKRNPCNPCAAKRNPCAARNPCNPCAAKSNPCAAKNPCNPCAAKNPCNPCGAGQAAKLTKREANKLYACLKGEMKAAYGKSGVRDAKSYANWKIYNSRPYVSDTHGGRYVNNYANREARAYGKFEKAGKMPKGAVLAKNSFTVGKDGRAGVGPLFLMEKMGGGFSKASHNWRYTLIMPTGAVVGTTRGRGSNNVKFCYECHNGVAEEQDAMLFLPEEYRKN